MSSRRQFLGTLGRIMGGGLLLPIAGKGALSLSDTANAAELPVRLSPLPFSADTLELRRIKSALAGIRSRDETGIGTDCPWYRTMTQEHRPTVQRLASRPVTSWTDCVELAEAIWSFHDKERADFGECTGRLRTGAHWQSDLVSALVEGVVRLGNGERLDPRERP